MGKSLYPELEGKCGIYMITNALNGKRYIGQSTNIKKRWQDHKTKALHSQRADDIAKPLYQDIRKDGVENFTIQILEECQADILKEREVYWIKTLGTYPNEYNHTPGGDIACEEYKHTEEQHGMAKFTLADVQKCRQYYQEGRRCKDVYASEFASAGYSYYGFHNMWHGRTWKTVMPEVFQQNPHPAKRVTENDIRDIRKRYDDGQSCRSIAADYAGKLSYTTIYGIAHRQTYQDSVHY